MYLKESSKTLKNGKELIIRSAQKEDAPLLVTYLKEAMVETPYLLREPDEITITVEQEENFLENQQENDKELMLVGFVEGEHVGNCSFSSISGVSRHRHRCDIAIALYQKYCGLGIGKILLSTLLEKAKECGYEQAELEVVSTNEPAVHLYESLGFEIYGTRPHGMKYKDGTYADMYLMMKKL